MWPSPHEWQVQVAPQFAPAAHGAQRERIVEVGVLESLIHILGAVVITLPASALTGAATIWIFGIGKTEREALKTIIASTRKKQHK